MHLTRASDEETKVAKILFLFISFYSRPTFDPTLNKLTLNYNKKYGYKVWKVTFSSKFSAAKVRDLIHKEELEIDVYMGIIFMFFESNENEPVYISEAYLINIHRRIISTFWPFIVLGIS